MAPKHAAWNLFLSLGVGLLLLAGSARAQILVPIAEDAVDEPGPTIATGAPPAAVETDDQADVYDDSYGYGVPTDDQEPAHVANRGSRRGATVDSGVKDSTVEVIRERYANRKVKIEREVAQDPYENYINHGSWRMWDEQGNLVASGQFVNGQRHGVWKRWHGRNDSNLFSSTPYHQFTAPFVSEATFDHGRLNGDWTISDSKQRKISQWSFQNDQRDGPSVWWYANGRKMREIVYRDGALDGKFLEWNAGGELVTSDEYQVGRKLAKKNSQDKNGEKLAEGIYLHAKVVVKTPDDWWNAQPATFTRQGKDEKHGVWTAWYPSGQIRMTGEYHHDVEQGPFTWWYSNGQKALEGAYKQGRQHGKWTWWHSNGQKKAQGEFANGQQIGRWTIWKENGKVAQAAEHAPAGTASKAADSEREASLPEEAETVTE